MSATTITITETRHRIFVDYENAGPTWWDAAREDSAAPASVRPLLSAHGPDEIVVDAQDAERIRAWASELPGWSGPDARAPHPIGLEIVEPDK